MSRPPHARPRTLAAHSAHAHSADCGCDKRDATTATATGRWTTMLPALACLVCPACLSLYAKVFAAFGVGLVISEQTHGKLLAVAVALSLATSLWRARKTGRWASFAVTLAGSSAVVIGHASERHAVEWAGVALLLASSVVDRRR